MIVFRDASEVSQSSVSVNFTGLGLLNGNAETCGSRKLAMLVRIKAAALIKETFGASRAIKGFSGEEAEGRGGFRDKSSAGDIVGGTKSSSRAERKVIWPTDQSIYRL